MAWPSNGNRQAPTRLLVANLAISALIVFLLPSSGLAAPGNEINKKRLESTARYLQDAQNRDGGFGGAKGSPSDQEFSAWAALALAADGINPQDQSQQVGSTSAYTYLAAHAGELKSSTDFERELLVVDASGTSPEDFGGVKLVRQILERQLKGTREAGGFKHEPGDSTPGVNDTIFAILALSPMREQPAVRTAIEHAVGWLLSEQNHDTGGWPSVCPETVADCSERDEVDMTGAAIQALDAAGAPGEAQARALKFLRGAQNPDGGFPEFPDAGEESNVASTAWAVQAIWAAGENPETWLRSSGREPLDYMESLQHEDGSIQWKAGSNSDPVWMTAYVAPAFAGDPWPIPAPQYVEPPPSDSHGGGAGSASPSSGSAEPGNDGESSQPGSGVIAGGGGNGALLFSRPQPQSRGRTPGGVRLLRSARKHATKRRRNPGRPRRAPAPTATTTAPEPSGDHNGLGSGSASTGSGSGRTGTSSVARGAGQKAEGIGSASAGAGSGRPAAGNALTGTGNRNEQARGQEVSGVLIGAASSIDTPHAPEPGAPGLRSAGVGGNETPWPAIGIGGAIVLLVLTGSQWERRRPQAIL